MKIFFQIILFSILFAACESATHIDIEAAIEEKVQERLDGFKEIIFKKCRRMVLKEASAKADSIILERARLLKDSLPRPLKPSRPVQPILLELKDSLALEPLFNTLQSKLASSTL